MITDRATRRLERQRVAHGRLSQRTQVVLLNSTFRSTSLQRQGVLVRSERRVRGVPGGEPATTTHWTRWPTTAGWTPHRCPPLLGPVRWARIHLGEHTSQSTSCSESSRSLRTLISLANISSNARLTIVARFAGTWPRSSRAGTGIHQLDARSVSCRRGCAKAEGSPTSALALEVGKPRRRAKWRPMGDFGGTEVQSLRRKICPSPQCVQSTSSTSSGARAK